MKTIRDGHLINIKKILLLIACFFCKVRGTKLTHFIRFCPVNEVMPYRYPWITVTGRSEIQCARECYKEPRCELFTAIKLGERSYDCELYDFVHHGCQPTSMETTTYRIQGRGVDDDHCPEQSMFFPSIPTSCYLSVTTDFNTITAAKAACAQYGANVHLVAIETQQEHEFLKRVLVQHNECGEWWTAGETLNPDTTDKDSWFWNLNTRTAPMLYTSWLGSEPNNYGGSGEKYLNMWSPTGRYYSSIEFQWTDVGAWFYGCALCEFELEI